MNAPPHLSRPPPAPPSCLPAPSLNLSPTYPPHSAAAAAATAMAMAVVGAAVAAVGAVMDPALLETQQAGCSRPQGVNYSCLPNLNVPPHLSIPPGTCPPHACLPPFLSFSLHRPSTCSGGGTEGGSGGSGGVPVAGATRDVPLQEALAALMEATADPK